MRPRNAGGREPQTKQEESTWKERIFDMRSRSSWPRRSDGRPWRWPSHRRPRAAEAQMTRACPAPPAATPARPAEHRATRNGARASAPATAAADPAPPPALTRAEAPRADRAHPAGPTPAARERTELAAPVEADRLPGTHLLPGPPPTLVRPAEGRRAATNPALLRPQRKAGRAPRGPAFSCPNTFNLLVDNHGPPCYIQLYD